MAKPNNPLDPFGYLNELRVGSSCGAAWERMEGGYRERFCSRCEKRVHDFRRLTAAEIDRRIGAHRGGLCVRLTRNPEGDLVFLGAGVQANESAPSPRRAQPAAAYLLTAMLGAASASAQSPAGAETAIESPGDPEADARPGELLAAGAYALDEELTVTGELGDGGAVTMGVLVAPPDPLPVAFSSSPLVVLATVGETTTVGDPDDVEAEGGYGEVESALEVDLVLKGAPQHAPLRLRYFAYVGEEGEASEDESTILPAGSSILVFLEPSAEDAGTAGEAIWKSVRAPRTLTEAEADAYRTRLEALASLLAEADTGSGIESGIESDTATSTEAGQESEADDAATAPELVEWLVATAEEPLTRAETVEELEAVEITPAQRERLIAALVATRRFAESDLSLFELVEEWAPEQARQWLREAAGEAAWSAARGVDPLPELWLFERAAEALGDDDLRSRLDAAEGRIGALYDAAAMVDAGLIAAQEAETITRDLLREIADELLRSPTQEEPPVR